ncbi:hypothetical protein QMK19_33850 [Streptomyces sp. H10-C2]|uniref:hypothetical protein n=1 Tax=unclassified Streptomyces TaxID=2593676 RepID=UPI0024BA7FE6|nr:MULTISPECIES: hypothetical protein [unclassified Streptomyces]MDJ0345532.1 hypothetical protein [Streptomyces sp. PH10-H1]MDJ0374478.1 hypothetical protein [Streptomyces sp. H10-C2]
MPTNPDGQQMTPATLDAAQRLMSLGRTDGVRPKPGFELDPDSGQQYRTPAELENAAGLTPPARTVNAHLPYLYDGDHVRP